MQAELELDPSSCLSRAGLNSVQLVQTLVHPKRMFTTLTIQDACKRPPKIINLPKLSTINNYERKHVGTLDQSNCNPSVLQRSFRRRVDATIELQESLLGMLSLSSEKVHLQASKLSWPECRSCCASITVFCALVKTFPL